MRTRSEKPSPEEIARVWSAIEARINKGLDDLKTETPEEREKRRDLNNQEATVLIWLNDNVSREKRDAFLEACRKKIGEVGGGMLRLLMEPSKSIVHEWIMTEAAKLGYTQERVAA